ncbi:Laminin subunit alpha-2 [Liparis tanakae]|uniref:Laminin subunit alpha-2 n=1 Tax=Liparis tanakae TaxID=230148 RepID=A0A4Z2FHW5_9TELE|nr:Laminin subunit alpha-2 [Liparis tanakae]
MRPEVDRWPVQSTKVSADGEQVEDDADRIHKRAEDLEQFIRDTLLGAQELQSKAADLNQTLSRRDGTPEKSLKQMKEEIQAMLGEMRTRQLGGKKSIADEEMDLAEELYQKVKRLFGDPHQATEDLKAEITEKLSDHEGKLQAAQDLLHSARGETRQAGSLAEQNQANLTALERKRSAVSGVRQEAQEVLGEGERLLDEANQLSDNINKEIEAVAADANTTAVDVLERLGDLNLQLYGIQRNYTELEDTVNAANQMIQDPEKNIHAAGAKAKDLEDEADRLLEKLQPIKQLQDNLRRNISQIKELINQARKQANSIKVSVSSGGDCLRSYRPDIRKGRYNTIVLHVKTTTADNLLFYLGSAKYVSTPSTGYKAQISTNIQNCL